MMDSNKIRKDFPQLKEAGYHYLDAAASSLTPAQVIDSIVAYYTSHRANVHRGLFKEAMSATKMYEDARTKVAKFINAPSRSEVIFTSGATESSNMLVRMLEETYKWEEVEKNIVTTEMEHHGALIPLQQLSMRAALELRHIPLVGFELDYVKAEQLIDKNTVLVSAMLASNVIGTINDVRRLGALAHKQGALMVVDATAAAGHFPIDVQALGCDALYFSGHKMMAPTGVGVLWMKKGFLEKMNPSQFGGHMISSVKKNSAVWSSIPEKFEAGTKNIEGVIGLGAAVDYLNEIKLQNIHEHITELVDYAISKLEAVPGIKVLAEHNVSMNSGVVSFIADWAHPHDIAEILARERVAVRPGHHCAEPLHAALGTNATTRASFHVYNTKEDIDALIAALKKAYDIFKE